MMETTDLALCIAAVTALPGIGSKTTFALCKDINFDSDYESTLIQKLKKRKIYINESEFKKQKDFYKSYGEKKEQLIISYWDKSYPDLLKEIADPPVLLFVKGNYENLYLSEPSLAIVGTRAVSEYGKHALKTLF